MPKQSRSWSKPDNIPNLIGIKKVDWSVFETGTTIPQEFHIDFDIANDGEHIDKGIRREIKLIIENREFDASLYNVPLNDRVGDTYQIRYDQNKELKEFLRKKFETSYKYLMNERIGNDGTKKFIHTPDHLSEFMEFYQTSKPFTYRVVLKPSTITLDQSSPSFWWVNQGQTHEVEKNSGFLWAPKKGKGGFSFSHHTDLTKAHPGDIIFAYSSGEIRAIAKVEQSVLERPKPKEITSDSWQEDGYLLPVVYYDLKQSIKKDEIPLKWRIYESGPFDKNGNVKQGYFFTVSKVFVKKLYDKFKFRFPDNVFDTSVLNMVLDKDTIESEEMNNEQFFVFESNQELINHIHDYISSKGFYYAKENVINLYLALKTKPFVILSGISGTGKSQIVRFFAESLGATKENGRFTLIPVRPDWSDGSDLLGYTDLKGEFQEGPLTRVLREASQPENREKPYFVLLDEMNLARVEYYFSDLLSIMESREWNGDQIVTDPIDIDKSAGGKVIIPDNVYIIGTVNMDETTHPFSQKVLDRANAIEFNEVKLDNFDFFEGSIDIIKPVNVSNASLRGEYIRLIDAYYEEKALIHRITEKLVQVAAILAKMNAAFGYRVRDEICFYMIHNKKLGLLSEDAAFDFQLHQKILPRLSGSDERTYQGLKSLYHFCTNRIIENDEELDHLDEDLQHAVYPKSARKLADMLRRQRDDGFTSFWF
jgi:hypothetical protein